MTTKTLIVGGGLSGGGAALALAEASQGAAVTLAFIVVNAPRLGMRTFDTRLWAVPIVTLGLGLAIVRRHDAKRFAQGGAPPDSIDQAVG